MGLDVNGIKFLLHSKSKGVSFKSTLMIGRQGIHLPLEKLQTLLAEYRPALPEKSLERISVAKPRYAEPLLQCLGAETVDSMDCSTYEHASLQHDLNYAIPMQYYACYDTVLDGGSLEHIFDIKQSLKNCMDMIKVGGHYLGISPANNFMGHGFYQFTPELFYSVFSSANGFEVEQVIIFESRKKTTWYEVLKPETIKSRVQLQNCEKTYLLVIARKVAQKDAFLTPPQQSDYQAVWSGRGSAAPNLSRISLGKNSKLQALKDRAHRLAYKIARKTYFEPLYYKKLTPLINPKSPS
jgi:hypothetical protein